MNIMIRLVFNTDFRYKNNQSNIFFQLFKAHFYFLNWWWGKGHKCFSGPYRIRSWTTLVGPKGHKVGQRRWGLRRGWLIVDLYYTDYIDIIEAQAIVKNVSSFFSLNNLCLQHIKIRGRGLIRVVGLEGV